MYANSDLVIMYISTCFFVCVCAGAWRSHDNLVDPSSGAAHRLLLEPGIHKWPSLADQHFPTASLELGPSLQAFSLLKYLCCWESKVGTF